jgi:hypothetical protein
MLENLVTVLIVLSGTSSNFSQCCGTVTFWYGSGSTDPCLGLVDPDPAIFVIDLQDANKKLFKNYLSFLLITF